MGRPGAWEWARARVELAEVTGWSFVSSLLAGAVVCGPNSAARGHVAAAPAALLTPEPGGGGSAMIPVHVCVPGDQEQLSTGLPIRKRGCGPVVH